LDRDANHYEKFNLVSTPKLAPRMPAPFKESSAVNSAQSNILDGVVERVRVGKNALSGTIVLPSENIGIVVFAPSSNSSLGGSPNGFIANVLKSYRVGALLLDQLTEPEAPSPEDMTDIVMDADRLTDALTWLESHIDLAGIPIGLLGIGADAAAVFQAAARKPRLVDALVIFDGRINLLQHQLARVRAPTLLIVSGQGQKMLAGNNRSAMRALHCRKHVAIVPRGQVLPQGQGSMDIVASLAAHWFEHHFLVNGSA
jgi:putative phosphoribosyl transferase